jgi:hypothetical protein
VLTDAALPDSVLQGGWPSHVGNPRCLAALSMGMSQPPNMGQHEARGMHCHGQSGRDIQHGLPMLGSCPILYMGQILPPHVVRQKYTAARVTQGGVYELFGYRQARQSSVLIPDQ